MSKSEMIDSICEINKNVKRKWLECFSIEELTSYLEHLIELDLEELIISE